MINFLNNVSEFPILHLATHAVSTHQAENYAYLAFAPDSNNWIGSTWSLHHLNL